MAEYEVRDVVCDYGVYEDGELKLILNSRRIAEQIVTLLKEDERLNQMLSHYRALVDEYGERDAYVSGYDDSIDTIQNFPTADVVPRSEVARDIQAFEKKVNEIYNRYVFEDTDYAEDDVAVEAVMNAVTDISNDLYELKDKYAKGGEG